MKLKITSNELTPTSRMPNKSPKKAYHEAVLKDIHNHWLLADGYVSRTLKDLSDLRSKVEADHRILQDAFDKTEGAIKLVGNQHPNA
jgi:hypothetical protein